MIITPQDIRAVRPIAENVNDDKRLIPYIEECETLYLIPKLGAKQFLSIEKAIKDSKLAIPVPLPDNIGSLMDGCYFDSDNQHSQGLKQAMGYLVYSRFVRNQNVNVTAFAVVAKQGQYSENVDEKTIIRISNDAEKIGLEYLKQCIDFLNFGKDKRDQRNFKPKCKFKAIGD
jgi:hypothetical protein